MENKALINEIFESVQGEGPYIGINQLFVRFASCNLKCAYCDTDYKINAKEYSDMELVNIINNTENIHSVSLTGGEPLLYADFLAKVLPKIDKKIYLETNGTLFENLAKVINYIDIISTDIKLPSSSLGKDVFNEHKLFINCALKYNKEIFLKVVFDEKITPEEIKTVINYAKDRNLLIILQPKTDANKINIPTETISKIFYSFNNQYNNVRLIPQVHKFLNLK